MVLFNGVKNCMVRYGGLLFVLLSVGCAHQLEVKNMGLYKPQFVNSQGGHLKLGISAAPSTPEEERLVMAVANSLKRDGFNVIYPFYPNEANDKVLDYHLKLTTGSQYKGSGWNFLINWPGFLVWAPAWHGYNYRVIYSFDADITDLKTHQSLPRISSPVDLDIRHADMGRTWTEISWLEWSAIAFVGGIIFTRYDHDITPDVVNATESKIGDYVASKIAAALVSSEQKVSYRWPFLAGQSLRPS
ncbi:MAG: hypothetical protein HY737_01775 [Candidatus Omnitrophica bacterium]|nr:hypothetical protein [Candidatus Omnitrophota bacterium]